MPRRNKTKPLQLSALKIPGFESGGVKREKPRDPRTMKYDVYGNSRTREEYLKTGIGRPISDGSRASLLEIVGMKIRGIEQSGVSYVPGLELAKRVNFGITDNGRLAPEAAAIDALEVHLSNGAVSLPCGSEAVGVRCLGFEAKQFGHDHVKILALFSDTEGEAGEPLIHDERVKVMEAFGLKMIPGVKPIDEVLHKVDLAITDEYSLSVARRVLKPISNAVFHEANVAVELLPVRPITTIQPV